MTNTATHGTAARMASLAELNEASRSRPPANRARADRWALLNAIVEQLGWMPHPEHRVLMVLFRHADRTGKAYPGQTGIARACGVDRAHVSRWLDRLVGWGVVEIVRRGHKGSRKAAEYRIRPPSEWPTEMPPR